MPAETVNLGFVIEGKGEVEALPLLVRRISYTLDLSIAVQTSRPVRSTKSKLLKPGELEDATRLAFLNNRRQGPVLVVVDADKDCPARLGRQLKARTAAIAQVQGVSIIIPEIEFESWFLAAAESLAGKRGLRDRLVAPENPEAVRDAKGWLTRNMVPGKVYSPTVDQAALAAVMDLTAARRCRSFDRLCREIKRLCSEASSP